MAKYGIVTPMSIPPTNIFRDRLRTARESKEISQGELAKRTGLQASAVSHFETGARKPSFENLRRLADALKVTTDYLLGRADEMDGAAASTDRLHRHYSGLTTEYQEVADGFIEFLASEAKRKKEESK